MHSEKKHTLWKNIKGMAEMEAVGMMAELQQIQRNRMVTFICVIQPSQTAAEIIIDHMPEGGSVPSYFAV